MSIIYDALKKVEGALHKTPPAGGAQAAPQNAPGGPLKKYLSFKAKPVVLLSAIFVICAIGGTASFFFLYQKNSTKKPSATSTTVKITPKQDLPTLSITPGSPLPAEPSVTPSVQGAPEPIASAPAPLPSPQLNNVVLNGVFFSQNEGYALLNNQIVKKGDVVEGATVKEISEEGVVLETAGATIKLTNNRR